MTARPLIGRDIFDFSETAEQNSTKIDRKHDINVLYQVPIFRADRDTKIVALTSDWLKHFRLLLWNRWTEFNEIWQEARSDSPLPSFVFFRLIRKARWPSGPIRQQMWHIVLVCTICCPLGPLWFFFFFAVLWNLYFKYSFILKYVDVTRPIKVWATLSLHNTAPSVLSEGLSDNKSRGCIMLTLKSKQPLDKLCPCLVRPKKNMCVYCHMLKKIRVGRSEIISFFSFIFYNWIHVGWHLECISTLEEWHLTRFCQTNNNLDIKNYIGRQK